MPVGKRASLLAYTSLSEHWHSLIDPVEGSAYVNQCIFVGFLIEPAFEPALLCDQPLAHIRQVRQMVRPKMLSGVHRGIFGRL
jgi:hypothetical protein